MLAEQRFSSHVLFAVNTSFIGAGIAAHNNRVAICAIRSQLVGIYREAMAPGTGGFVALFGTAGCLITSPITSAILKLL